VQYVKKVSFSFYMINHPVGKIAKKKTV